VLNRMTQQEGEDANVENSRLHFRINDGKVNLAPPAEEAAWCKLESVSLGNDIGGPPDLVGVATRWRWPDPFDEVSVNDLREVQKRLAIGHHRADSRSKEWAGFMVAEVLGWDLLSASVKKDLQKLLKKWCTSGAVREVSRKDDNRNTRKFLEKGDPV
jgi:hypothetical protein